MKAEPAGVEHTKLGLLAAGASAIPIWRREDPVSNRI
jgi:hypothetical protein